MSVAGLFFLLVQHPQPLREPLELARLSSDKCRLHHPNPCFPPILGQSPLKNMSQPILHVLLHQTQQ